MTTKKQIPADDASPVDCLLHGLDFIPDALTIVDPSGVVIGFNKGAQRLLGYSKKEAVGKNITYFYEKNEYEKIIPHVKRAMEKKLAQFETVLLHKDGTNLHVLVSVAGLFDQNDTFLGTVGVTKDISEMRETQSKISESDTRYRELLDSMKSAVAVYETNDKGRTFVFQEFNKAAQRIDQTDRKDVIGRELKQVFPGAEEFGIIDVLRRVWKSGKPESLPMRMYQDDRIVGWRDNYIYRLPTGEVVAVYDDVTQQKKIEQEIQNRDSILNAVSYAAEKFLSTSSWSDCIHDVLGTLGESSRASRVYIFQNYEKDNTVYCKQLHEWTAHGVTSQRHNKDLQNFPLEEQMPRWVKKLSKGEVIHGLVKDFPEGERPTLTAQQVIALLDVPIFVNGQWWGFLGLDECKTEHTWSEVEVEALKTAANIVGFAIKQSQVLKDLAVANNRFLEKNQELEKINALMVGRELRMAELKEKIKVLEKKS